MSQKTKDQLTDTAQNFFHLLEQFAKLKRTHCMNLLILENSIQDLTSLKLWRISVVLLQKLV